MISCKFASKDYSLGTPTDRMKTSVFYSKVISLCFG